MSKKDVENQKRRQLEQWENNIPQALCELPNWVLWKYHIEKGKRKKVPYSTNGEKANPSGKSTWNYYKPVVNAYREGNYDGIGFMFGYSDYMGIDIDHAINDGQVSEMATDIITTVGVGYVEISPSGTGVHIISKATKPKGRCKRSFGDGQEIEMYDTGRFFTITGNIYSDEYKTYSTINDDATDVQDAIYSVFGKYWVEQDESTDATRQNKPTVVGVGLNTEMIIARIEAGKGGKKSLQGDNQRILALWRGDWQGAGYPSQSEGDLAFCNCLAFWSCKNADTMAKVFIASGLYRAEKWEQITNTEQGLSYGQQLIAKAIDSTIVVYNPQAKQFGYQSLEFPQLDDDGQPIPQCVENTAYLLEYLGIKLAFNQIAHTVDVWHNDKRIYLNYDSTVVDIRSVAYKNGLKITKDDLYGHLRNIADKNAYNPLVEYLKSCYDANSGVDCESEFEKLCKSLVLDNLTQEETTLCYHLLRLWLRQVVYLACNKGYTKPQSILVLKGSQGIGKSSFVAKLLPREMVLSEQTLVFGNKDNEIMCTSVGICELSELGSTVKSANRSKQWLTREQDRYRAPYDRTDQTYPRHTSFVGTVNDATFLVDKTGNRRYFVLPLKSINWSVLNGLDYTKLWACIVSDYKANKPYDLTQTERLAVNMRNERYNKMTEIEQILLDKLSWSTPKDYWRLVTPSNLCEELTGKNDKASVMGRRLQELADKGKIEQPQRRHNTGVCLYRLPPKIMDNTDGKQLAK